MIVARAAGARPATDRVAAPVIGLVSVAVVGVVGYLVLAHRPRAGGPDAIGALPLLNACLNATSAGLLAAGFLLVRRGRVGAHRVAMAAALGVSTLFLISYVAHHWLTGSQPFAGQGWIRPVYYAILLSHVGLAAVLPPAALGTVYLAARGDFGRHRRLARWTLPIWLYVSVTGVLVYWMVYHLGRA